jgi:hypothetical protein
MRNIDDRPLWVVVRLLLLLPGIVTIGCERPVSLDPEVPAERRILRLVEDVDDFAQTPRELKVIPRLFAPGREPSDKTLPRYADYRYEAKPPVQSGDSATVAVIIKDAKTDKPAGEVQWSMTKVKGVWKIKDAPLPAK